MNFQFYLEKLFASEEFEKFKQENKDAYFCSGFFSIDKKSSDQKQNLDYYVPSTKKWISFKIHDNVEKMNMESYDERIPEKLADNFDFDFKELENLVVKKMEQEKIKKAIEKCLYSLQSREGKTFLVGTIFISGLGILKVIFDLEGKTILEFEKKSFFDMMKIIKK